MSESAVSATRMRSVWRSSKTVLWLGFVIGLSAFAYYYLLGLSTAHYDAKAHLLVSRRMVDSTTPGYSEMGAHWLPLVHILYLPFVLMEAQYRTGMIPSLLSVCGFAVSGWMVFRMAFFQTGSTAAAWFAALILLANANLQYLQSAPLTEPVYMALSLLAIDALVRWREAQSGLVPWQASLWIALAALCRYEGWLLFAGVVLLLAGDFFGRRLSRRGFSRALFALAGSFAAPVLAHFAYIYWRLGDSFFLRVARGNPAPDETYKRPLLSLAYHGSELFQAAGLVPLGIGLAGLIYCLADRGRRQRWRPVFLLWLPSLLNLAALYWGLMYRVRYSLLLIPAVAVFGSLAATQARFSRRVLIAASLMVFLLPWITWLFPDRWEYHFARPGAGILLLPAAALLLLLAGLHRGRFAGVLALLAISSMQVPALEGEARPMLAEALEHAYLEPERRQVLEYLQRHYDGSRILVDIGRQAPLMYDSALPVREFVCHDGNVAEWDEAVAEPRRHVGWLCAEKGDEVWTMLEIDPRWSDGYALAVSTENYVLYHLDNGIQSARAQNGP